MNSSQKPTNNGVMNFRKQGQLAYVFCGKRLDLLVMKSQAGWYIGTADEDGPCSRESVEYFGSDEAARIALRAGEWTQRQNP